MKQLKDNSFEERRKASLEAKKQLLKKFEAAPKPDDPEMLAKRAEREAIARAREERQAERARLKAEVAAAKQAEIDAQAAAEAAKRRVLTPEEQKAERDRRYAARKARQR
ncbi:MAG TPA: DUF6481 family protein [Devosiaceae bacterium]|jgi:hypothetical protein